MISQIRFNAIGSPAALVGLQEVLKMQLDDIVAGLNANSSSSHDAEWAFVGVGRDDGKEKGEYSPILYRPSVWELQKNTTLWLSPTPDVPGSKGWDAAVTRIVTIVDFKHRETGTHVVAMNTHFDHIGTIARENSARIITEQIKQRLQESDGSSPPSGVLLTGDFNSQPSQEAYQYLTQESSPVFDVRTIVPGDQWYGVRNGTFSGFRGQQTDLLDHIFLSKQTAASSSKWIPETYAVLANKFGDDIYYSDHQAVVTDVKLHF